MPTSTPAGMASRWASVGLSYSGVALRISIGTVWGSGCSNVTPLGVGLCCAASGVGPVDAGARLTSPSSSGVGLGGSVTGVSVSVGIDCPVFCPVFCSVVDAGGAVVVVTGLGDLLGDGVGVMVMVLVTTGSAVGLALGDDPTGGVWVTVTVTTAHWGSVVGSHGSTGSAFAPIIGPTARTASVAMATDAAAEDAALRYTRPITARLLSALLRGQNRL